MYRFNRKPKRPFFKPFCIIGGMIFLVWAGGFLFFMTKVPKDENQVSEVTDAIVVLTGGTHRLNAGIDLLSQKKGHKLFISGVYHSVELRELLRLSKQSPQELECCIEIGHEADNTRGNARETQQWIVEHGYKSLRLVTANYHMPRSLLEFQNMMPNVKIIEYPVFPEHVKVDEWWRWSGTAFLLFSEYNKYLMVYIRQRIADFSGLEFLR